MKAQRKMRLIHSVTMLGHVLGPAALILRLWDGL
jgi:hypothetical protein